MVNSTHLSISLHFMSGTMGREVVWLLFQMKTMWMDSRTAESGSVVTSIRVQLQDKTFIIAWRRVMPFMVDTTCVTVLEYGTGLRVATQDAPPPNFMREFGDHERRMHLRCRRAQTQISDLRAL